MTSRPERYRVLALALLLAAGVSGAACRQDMHDAPRFNPLRKSDFYDDHRSGRPLIEDTVPRGWLMADDGFATGKVNGQYVAELPSASTSTARPATRAPAKATASSCSAATSSRRPTSTRGWWRSRWATSTT
jgi:hypothetical protein